MRTDLSPRRQSHTFDFEHSGQRYNATYSCFEVPTNLGLTYEEKIKLVESGIFDRPAEIFVHTEKRENDMTALMRDAAILISIALQHGASIEVIQKALTRKEDGQSPASPISKCVDELIGDLHDSR